jgi:hypothetical protein
MSYRSDVDALEARHDALDAEVTAKTHERDATRRLLDDARARVSLPVLDNIHVAAPCSADWAAMTGDDRVRHCGSCRKNVYNLTDMTRDEADALLVEHEGRMCVRYYRRHDGTILTADCQTGRKYQRGRRMIIAGVTAIVLGTLGSCAHKVMTGPFMGKVSREPVHAVVADPAP